MLNLCATNEKLRIRAKRFHIIIYSMNTVQINEAGVTRLFKLQKNSPKIRITLSSLSEIQKKRSANHSGAGTQSAALGHTRLRLVS